jgi:hypothetical protein
MDGWDGVVLGKGSAPGWKTTPTGGPPLSVSGKGKTGSVSGMPGWAVGRFSGRAETLPRGFNPFFCSFIFPFLFYYFFYNFCNKASNDFKSTSKIF